MPNLISLPGLVRSLERNLSQPTDKFDSWLPALKKAVAVDISRTAKPASTKPAEGDDGAKPKSKSKFKDLLHFQNVTNLGLGLKIEETLAEKDSPLKPVAALMVKHSRIMVKLHNLGQPETERIGDDVIQSNDPKTFYDLAQTLPKPSASLEKNAKPMSIKEAESLIMNWVHSFLRRKDLTPKDQDTWFPTLKQCVSLDVTGRTQKPDVIAKDHRGLDRCLQNLSFGLEIQHSLSKSESPLKPTADLMVKHNRTLLKLYDSTKPEDKRLGDKVLSSGDPKMFFNLSKALRHKYRLGIEGAKKETESPVSDPSREEDAKVVQDV